jgi:MSHA type pilus biogenesis protein MshL
MMFRFHDSCHQNLLLLFGSGLLLLMGLLNGCAPQPPIASPGHINTNQLPPPKNDIPPLIQQHAFIPSPQLTPPQETFTVVVDNVPVDKLLFALARDANLNIDIHSGIKGSITLNAVNQTLTQLLERIANQIDLRYQLNGTHLIISPDLPYLRLYKVDYVNLARESTSEISVATQIISDINRKVGGSSSGGGDSGGGGSANNNSTTQIKNKSDNRFWEILKENIQAILASHQTQEKSITGVEDNVIVNPQSNVISVRATHKQHEEIQRFLDQVMVNVQRQVLIEATIVEVRLNDNYQAGVDWQRIAGDFTYQQSMLKGNIGQDSPFYAFGYSNPESAFGNISAMVRLLEEFGTVKVISSPQIMALNNQTAILKVVDNLVYFTTEVEINETDTRSRETYTTQISTVPVGLVMSVTPQISDNDEVILNVRPTISRVLDYKVDPNPVLAQAGTVNRIPQIEVREIESILKVNNADIAIIGGLMQDSSQQNKQGVPVLSQLPLIGDLFSYRNDNHAKSELIIFLRPTVIKSASVSGDLQNYQRYLPDSSVPESDAPTGFTLP